MLTTAGIILAVLALAAVAFVAYGRAETWALVFGDPDLGHFDRSAPTRSPNPNDALLCTPGLCEGVAVDVELPEYETTPQNLIERVDVAMHLLEGAPRRVDDRSDPARARYVTFSQTMKFPDTNSFEAVALENGRTGLVAYARAQLGRSDMGANRRRLEEIVARLAD